MSNFIEWFGNFVRANGPFFIICVMVYLYVLGACVAIYAFKTKGRGTKSDNPKKHMNNEIALAISVFAMATVFPFVFNLDGINDYVRFQIYFHFWFSLTVNLFCQIVFALLSKHFAKRKGRTADYNAWVAEFLDTYEPTWKKDLQRKLLHLTPGAVIISFYLLGNYLNPFISEYGWTGTAFTYFMSLAIAFHFVFVMIFYDLVRLVDFSYFGGFPRNWAKKSIHPSELHTFTSASVLVFSLTIFIFAPFVVLFSTGLIGSLSDAAASFIGKLLGKRKLKNGKTMAGYVAGFTTTMLIVVSVEHFFPTGVPLLGLGMGIIAGTCFLLIDIFATNLTDNFLNNILCGSVLWLTYAILA